MSVCCCAAAPAVGAPAKEQLFVLFMQFGLFELRVAAVAVGVGCLPRLEATVALTHGPVRWMICTWYSYTSTWWHLQNRVGSLYDTAVLVLHATAVEPLVPCWSRINITSNSWQMQAATTRVDYNK